ncbi:hypothetical protein RHGRI_010178 [Rhododendron griersonianum]|uniref:X8 domain-containing protein n=1 Tax=Rhododendron griersonianum TaxID=479676 RepID=A0AAV6KHJ1_9ERIC|nr:hypothetical protein RHGRI_010178 [Rhododendron griersonianum]KAG5552006.1 hypothetical protein RHGRI_010178 [Rhododendron griersonianum]
MASPPSPSLILSLIFLTATHLLHSPSHASPLAPNRLRLQTAVAQSASAASNGGAGATVQLWCVAKNNAEDSALQSALDWACGSGKCDCGPIQAGGPCYDSADLLSTASYAFNDYFLKNGLTEDSCNFNGVAALTSLNPSHGGCKFPSSLAVNNGSVAGSTILGLSPDSEDISGGDNVNAGKLCWAFITFHLLYASLQLH